MFDEEEKFAARKEAKHNFEAGERLSKRKKPNTKTQKQALQQSDTQSRTITEPFRQALLFSPETESPTNEGVFFPGR